MRSIDEYIAELEAANVSLVVDVRETAWSHKRDFSKNQLRDALRKAAIDYLHLEFAGNPKELRSAAESHAACLSAYDQYLLDQSDLVRRFAEHLREWLSAGVRACLLCYERHPDDCHRTVLLSRAIEVMEESVNVRHLAPNGAERFS